MSERKIITGILLTTGRGTRFGGDKCLAALPDVTTIAAHAAKSTPPAWTGCVVRGDDAELRAMFERQGFQVAPCPQADGGMSASLMAGVTASSADTSDWLIELGACH